MKDGLDGIASEGWGLVEGEGYAIEGYGLGLDVDWTGGRKLTVDINPIRL